MFKNCKFLVVQISNDGNKGSKLVQQSINDREGPPYVRNRSHPLGPIAFILYYNELYKAFLFLAIFVFFFTTNWLYFLN